MSKNQMSTGEQRARGTGGVGTATSSAGENPFVEGSRHAEAIDSSGVPIGTVEQVYTDVDSGAPRWAEVAGGLFGMAHHIVPAAGASREGQRIRFPVTAEQVCTAPAVDPQDGITVEEDSDLSAHYRLPPAERRETR